MSIYEPERASIPGVLDSDAVAAEGPVSAKLLREIARTGNFLRDAGSNMLVASWPEISGVSPLAAFAEDRLVWVWPGCPSRPVHTQAEVRIRAIVENGRTMRFSVRTADTDVDIDATGTGVLVTYQGTLPLRPRDRHPLSLWVRGLDVAAATAVGTPTSWDGATNATIQTLDSVSPTTESWIEAELNRGVYQMVWEVNSTGVLIAQRTILRAVPGEVIHEPLTPAITAVLNDLGTDIQYRIVTRGTFEVRGIYIRGIP